MSEPKEPTDKLAIGCWPIILFAIALIFQDFIETTLHGLDPKDTTALFFFTIADYLVKIIIFIGVSISIILTLSPLVFGFYCLVENGLIPGPLDDYLAEKWAPLKKYVNKDKLVSVIKWTGTTAAIIGGTMLASKTTLTPYGFIFLAVSSSLWLVTGFLTKDRPLIVLNLFLFIMVDVHGIYRWIISS